MKALLYDAPQETLSSFHSSPDVDEARRTSTGRCSRDTPHHLRGGFPTAKRSVRVDSLQPSMEGSAPLFSQTVDSNGTDWSEVVQMWLDWNKNFERLTVKMCSEGQDHQDLETMLDQLDQLRHRAISMSEGLIRC